MAFKWFKKKAKVKSDTATYYVPMYYEHLTVGHWCDYHLAKTTEQKVAAALQIDIKEAMSIDVETANKILTVFENSLTGDPKFKIAIDLGNKPHRFVPKLDAISLGEHADIVNNAKQETIFKTLPKVLAILYRPVTATLNNKYTVEPYDADIHLDEERIKLFRSFPMQQADGALAFFLTICNELLSNLELSLAKQMKSTMEEV
jgi:hypothetical protein